MIHCGKILGDRDNAVDAIFGIEFEQEDKCQETDAEPVKTTTSLDYKLRVNIDGGSSSTDKVDHMFQGMHKALKGQIEKMKGYLDILVPSSAASNDNKAQDED